MSFLSFFFFKDNQSESLLVSPTEIYFYDINWEISDLIRTSVSFNIIKFASDPDDSFGELNNISTSYVIKLIFFNFYVLKVCLIRSNNIIFHLQRKVSRGRMLVTERKLIIRFLECKARKGSTSQPFQLSRIESYNNRIFQKS